MSNPAWLESLRVGESPLLPEPKWDFVARVISSVLQKVPTAEGKKFSRPPHRVPRKSDLEDNFEKVVSYLRKNVGCKDDFIEMYPNWHYAREVSIRQLSSIAGSVREFNREAAGERTLGGSVALVGGAITLAGGINLFTRIVGGAAMGLGALITFVSSMDELKKVKEKLKDAQEVLEEDKRHSKKIFELLNDGSYVEEAINDIKSQVGWDIENAVHQLLTIYEKSLADAADVDKKIRYVLEGLHIPPKQSEEIANVIGILMSVLMLCKQYPLLLKIAKEGFEHYKGAFKQAVIAYEILKAAPAIKNGTVQLNSLKKLQLGVYMASIVVDIYRAAKDFNSLSKDVELINKAISQLRQEERAIENIYKELFLQ